MRRMIVILQDFTFSQPLQIYDENDTLVPAVSAPRNKLEYFINENVMRYNIDEIILNAKKGKILVMQLESLLKDKYENKIKIKVIQ